MKEFYRKHWELILNLSLLFGTLLIAAIAFKLVVPYLLPFVFGLILALSIEPLVKFFLKTRMPRILATATAMLVAVGVLGSVTWLAVSRIIVELVKFIANAPVYTSILKNDLLFLTYQLQSYVEGLPPELAHQLNRNTVMFTEMLSNRLSGLAGELLKIIMNLPSQLLIVVIALIATFFLSKDLIKLKSRAASVIPANIKNKLKIIADEIYSATIGFLKAQLILSAITSFVVLTGLLILHTEYVVTISLLCGLVSPIPVLGVGAVFVPWIFFCFFAGNSNLALGLIILFAVVVIVKHSLEPKVLGHSIGVDPLSVLIALYVGYELFGAYGFLLGPFVLITYYALKKVKAFAWLFKEDQNKREAGVLGD